MSSPARPVRRGTNLLRMGDFNQTVILDTIRRSSAGISRVELAEVTGLSAQAISNIVRQLLDAGLVRESGRAAVARGKPRTLLALEPTGQFAVGVHLDPVVITYVILDLTGATVAHLRLPTPARVRPEAIVAEMAAEIEALIARAGVPRARVGGVGIAAPGPIDIAGGIVVDPPNLEGWRRVPLREALAAAVGLPVLLDKDVTAAAAGQKWIGGLKGSGNFVFFYLGTGVGAGVVINDEVVRGSSYNVGEIGHMIADSAGPPCKCGRRGCVGACCSPRYLVQRGIAADVLAATIELDDRQQVAAAFAELCRQAAAANPAAVPILTELAGRIGHVVEDIANLLDLDQVVFGGPHWPQLEPFFDAEWQARVSRRFEVHKIHALSMAGTSLGADVGAIGAASLVLDHSFSTNPSVLLFGA